MRRNHAQQAAGEASAETGDADELMLERGASTDAAELVRLRDANAAWLIQRGIVQWRPGEIRRRGMTRRIESGTVWVLRGEAGLRAAVQVAWSDERTWGEVDRTDAGYIHMLMVDRAETGKRLGAGTLAWAENHIRQADRALARLDCVATNPRLCRYYEDNGYRRVGTRVHDDARWAPGALLEKLLPGS
jgi:protein-tyrosine phosphatase